MNCKLAVCILAWAAYPIISVASGGVFPVTEHVPLSILEVDSKVRKWLEDTGFEVAEEGLKPNGVKVLAKGTEPDLQWSIELRPYSPLGTEVRMVITGEQATDDLASRLIESLRETDTVENMSGPGGAQAIPGPILNQIGNVACIQVQTGDRVLQFSGFFIDREGLVLCTAHDLLEHERVSVTTNTGVHYEGTIIKADVDRDLALISVDAAKDEIVEVIDGRNLLSMGETVFSIGCPVNLRGTIESGFINGPPRKLEETVVWQAQMKIQPGSSGSPVFDSSGAFVAVVKGRHRETEDIGFLIPLEVVIDFLKEYFSS